MEEMPRQQSPCTAENACGCAMDGAEQANGHHRPGKPPRGRGPWPEERRGGARLTVYFLISIICNFLLAIYALYAVGLSAQLSQDALAAGQNATLAETMYQLALLLSPILLTLLLNRLLFCAMRGRRRRFARWATPAACLVTLAVQAATILLIWYFSGANTAGGFNVDTITSILPQ